MRAHFTAFLVLTTALAAGCSQPVSPTGPTAAALPVATANRDSMAAFATDTNQATGSSVPFTGRFEGTYSGSGAPPVITVHVLAEGSASQLGRFTFDSVHDVNFVDLTGVGTVVLTAANGDTLTANETGIATPLSAPGSFHIVETLTVTGGTGRFEGATGEVVVERLSLPLGPDSGTTSGSFEGRLTLVRGHD